MSSGKKSNRTKILEFVFRNAPVSRATIVENTEITPATVTTTIAALIEENIIMDLGETEELTEITPGRKRILVDLNANHCYGMGIEITEKYISFCITNLRGIIIDSKIIPSTLESTKNITDIILFEVDNLIHRNYKIANKIVGIGIAIPGKLNADENLLITDSIVSKSICIKTLKENLQLPIILENNIRSMAYGQYLFNAANCPEDFAFFQVSTGMYCAYIVNGEIIKESKYISGEIGHTIVQINGRKCECGKYGCLQTYASERFLIRAAKLLYTNNGSPILKSLVKCADELTIDHIITAYKLGEPIICDYITQALKYISMTTSNISIIMNPTKIFLHGQLFEDCDIYRQLMDYINCDLTFMEQNYAENIEILSYNPVRGALGASAIAIKTYFIMQ